MSVWVKRPHTELFYVEHRCTQRTCLHQLSLLLPETSDWHTQQVEGSRLQSMDWYRRHVYVSWFLPLFMSLYSYNVTAIAELGDPGGGGLVRYCFLQANRRRIRQQTNKNDTSQMCLQWLITHSTVQFCHTRYWALGPELIPVYRQSARRLLFKSSPGGRLPLLFVRPAVTFLAKKRHRPSTGTKLYCLVTEAHRCEQLAQGFYAALPQ